MAIKTSNQITFTEQKKILEIKEWYLATNQGTDVTLETIGWTEEIQIINETNKYLWNYEEVVYSIGSSEKSEPIIIGFYGKGTDGKGISDIKNYYFITQNPELPESPEWSEDVLMLTPTDKYLWNYDKIIYTDGTHKSSDPAIIGVYGDSGSGAIDFQIYSVDGFEFNDNLTSIDLMTIAFQDGKEIDSGVSYQWKWWNSESVLDDKYEVIPGATSSTLTVNITNNYAFTSLKCEITYDGIVYEDHVSLTRQTSVYTAVVKFFNGSNMITSDDEYLIAYVELYKDNNMVESIQTNKVHISDNNVLQNNIISTDLTGTYNDNDKMYFVCKNEQGVVSEYDVILGQYASGQWQLISSDYIYKNDLYDYTTSPIVFIPKIKISRSLDINFIICNNDSIVARTNTTVLDFNDPVIGDEPSDKKKGMLWLDTLSGILKMWDGAQWVDSNYQKGNIVYTSQPSSYSKGDLWILASGEKLGNYGEGCMLRAINTSSSFNSSDWEDVDEEGTEQKNNIKQYFDFNKDTGLKIGQSNNKFYVNISSTRMSFCENPLINGSEIDIADPNEVVSIGNKSATIKDLTVEDGAVFNCEVHFGKFVLKTESNGSLSLALTN
jgi:hypothetical protein